MNQSELRRALPELAAEESLSADERALLRCRLARRFEGAGDYEEARELLLPFWPASEQRPGTEGLGEHTGAELLLRAGVLTGWMSGDRWEARPQETAKDLLTESLFAFERLGLAERAAEARVELATAYWREGAFEEARALLSEALGMLGGGADEMRALVLLRQALAENSSTRFEDARRILLEAAPLFESLDDHALKGKFHNQLAHALQGLGTAESRADYIDRALVEATAASYHFEQAGHVRYQAHVENNLGFLYHTVGRSLDAHQHLDRALSLFESLGDNAYAAQVKETRARVLLAEGRAAEAERSARAASEVFEDAGEQALLAEALTTRGTALARLGRFAESRDAFARAAASAEESGGREVAGLALLSMIEELGGRLGASGMADCYRRADELLARSQEPELLSRLRRAARHALDALEDGARAHSAGRVERMIGAFLERTGRRLTFTPEAVGLAGSLFAGEDTPSFLALLEETAAAAPDGATVTAEAVEVVALRRLPPRGNFAKPWADFSLREELREPEKRFIELALKAADGKISVAARLLGLHHNEILTSIINSRYPDLIAARLPPIPRKRSIIRKPKR
ncbi:MAG TPA: tetratricopeptide repeat protein [Pyrinomonadaceae bacterium]